jgi:hypothetical protein
VDASLQANFKFGGSLFGSCHALKDSDELKSYHSGKEAQSGSSELRQTSWLFK